MPKIPLVIGERRPIEARTETLDKPSVSWPPEKVRLRKLQTQFIVCFLSELLKCRLEGASLEECALEFVQDHPVHILASFRPGIP